MVDQDTKIGAEEQLSLAFRALGDPTRRAIIRLIREAGELRVGDVSAAFDISLNGVSKHLKVLERAALISRRIEGKTHWISADGRGLVIARDWLDAEHHLWSRRLEALNDIFSDSNERSETDDS